MRRLSQSAFLAVVVLLAALPHLLADDAKPPQVQLDVTVVTCSPDALAGTKLRLDSMPPVATERLSGPEHAALFETVRAHKQTKLMAEPKVIANNGRPCSFFSGGQLPVPAGYDEKASVEFRHIGYELNVLPTVHADGRLHLECRFKQSDATTEWSAKVTNDLTAGQTLAIAGMPFGSGKKSEQRATLLLMTPTVLGAPAPTSAELQPERLKKIAALLVDEYRSACDANNADLAAKLARQALELDPMCFRQPHASCPTPATYPVAAGVLPVAVAPQLDDKPPHPSDYLTPGPPPVTAREPALLCPEQPGDAEIVRSLPKGSREDVEIVCEKMVDKIDAPRFFPLVGPARLHHCHWKCTVYSADAKTMQRRCEVIYIDKDFLHTATGEPVGVPESKPTGTKVGRWLDTFRSRLINVYSTDPNERMKQLLNQSEDMRDWSSPRKVDSRLR